MSPMPIVIALVACLALASPAGWPTTPPPGASKSPSPSVISGHVTATRDLAAPTALSYYLMFIDESGSVHSDAAAQIEHDVRTQLEVDGLTERDDLLSADIVITLRCNVEADRPSIDAILAGADPARPLDTGRLLVLVEAFDVARYANFLRSAGEDAAPDAFMQFLVWQTAVQSRGRLDDPESMLSSMASLATEWMGESTEGPEAFSIPVTRTGTQRKPG